MNRLLMIGHSHDFESRLHDLLGSAVHVVRGQSLAFGPAAVLGRLMAADRPHIALLGSSLPLDTAHRLSAGLTRLYPGIVTVADIPSGRTGWCSDQAINAALIPSAEKIRAQAEGAFSSNRRLTGVIERPRPDVGRPDVRPGLVPEAWDNVAPAGVVVVEVEVEVERMLDQETHLPVPLALPESAAFPAAGEGLRSRVIAVVAPKGGLGKTTVATNLAVGLAKHAPMSVVLIDADVQFGDVATALSLNPSHTLPDVVAALAQDNMMVLKTFLVPHSGGFYTVCGADQPDDGDRVTGDELSHLIGRLTELFRYVIIDTAPGLGDHALAALEQATDAVFLCDMSVPSARGLRKELAVLSRIGLLPPTRHVVLNLADRASGLSVRDVESIIGVPVDVAVPRSKYVALSTNRGIPLLQSGARNPGSAALTNLVQRFEPNASLKRGHLHRRVVVA
ncbi:MinD/ParA family protein [Cryobacterium algoritolerans]|uniref:MinD/ParA family protein n=1 Tax=Cryobacterium algoritolerans TaxID=1259184 RepID=A0A4R8WRL0_9MICO|nr:AAA family ATPase [Cryobacterium algoritolerans]TFC15182.1 MinD/ParA family protein [Cryobacterium algoritolerans]